MSAQTYYSVREKPSGKWESLWRDATGQIKGKCWLTKAQALAYAKDQAIHAGNVALGLAVNAKSVQEALDEWLMRSNLSPLTVDSYGRALNAFISNARITSTGQITAQVIHGEMSRLKPKSGGTRWLVWGILNGFCKFCIKNKWLKENPTVDIPRPQSEYVQRAVSPEDFERIISLCDEDVADALIMGRETMLRISQVLKLTTKDVANGSMLHISIIKGQPAVEIPVTARAQAVIAKRLANAIPGERLFTRWARPDGLQRYVRHLIADNGLPKWMTYHSICKRGKITELDQKGYGLGELQHLSNTSGNTLMRYYIKGDRNEAFKRYLKESDNGETRSV